MKYLRWLLFPFSLLYGLVVIFRNWCYDAGFFKSYKFNKPVISVGNLDVGGAGKSPMTEYLVSLLKQNHKLATLSRGYGRTTKGYIEAGNEATTEQIGDEPAQFKHKFPDVTVAVCEKRVAGLKKLLPGHDIVLLDDAYQHRAVAPGLSILLFDYNRLNEQHLLLPAGNLREPFSGRWRAQILVVTKCPPALNANGQLDAAWKVEPMPYQRLFFSSIIYQPLQDLQGKPANVVIDNDTTVFLLTGIANAAPLLAHITSLTLSVIHHNYPDHHRFTPKNIAKLAAEYEACKSQKKIIVTTEKDARRLQYSALAALLPGEAQPPVFVAPITVGFLNDGGLHFNRLITDYVREHTTYNELH